MSSAKKLSYDPWCYDNFLCLKVPFALAVSIFYLARNLIVPFTVFAIARKTQSEDMFYLLSDANSLIYLLCSLPALVIAVCWSRRTPKGGIWVRWLWSQGRGWLTASALLDLSLRIATTTNFFKGFTLAACLLDIYIVVYLFMSVRVRDVFEDFPEAELVKQKP